MRPQLDHSGPAARLAPSLALALALFATACSPQPAELPAPGARLVEPPATVAPVAAVESPPTAVPTSPPAPTVQPTPAPTTAPIDGHTATEPIPAPLAPEPKPEPPVESRPAAAPASVLPNPCETALAPLPPPGSPERWRGFREPLPLTPLWNPPGTKRVGLQAGHWQVEQVPAELRGLGHGASGGGKQEWEVNLEIARRAKALLEARGVEVDLLPATVPPRYQAHAFVSIHADGDTTGRTNGFKIARPGFSSVPEADDRLVSALNAAYGRETGLPRDDEHITLRMLYYYAFNSRRYCHAVAPGVPQVIVEAGFMTSAADRALLIGNPGAAARGIADGILTFLDTTR
jgi:N-acetylmuramoyl-L-alanine amidase